jgi:hypothetical protein
VNGGPVISLSQLNKIDYDFDTEVVKVGPGNRWQDVVFTLSRYNRNVVGGRVGHVGVSGLLLGGGLGFQSAQYGWASTHVLEYEVVLANGTVTKASRDHNKDLYWVLQGGGNNFGIITEISLRTIPLSPVGRLLDCALDITHNVRSGVAFVHTLKTKRMKSSPRFAILQRTIPTQKLRLSQRLRCQTTEGRQAGRSSSSMTVKMLLQMYSRTLTGWKAPWIPLKLKCFMN